ncbi:hypothetical protein [uncultured Gimesia sp.]|uniref:hypothetical protein n=1 Tax=uncultured Gimesia sp. TaxID=1678688 RepID=UPI0030DC94D4
MTAAGFSVNGSCWLSGRISVVPCCAPQNVRGRGALNQDDGWRTFRRGRFELLHDVEVHERVKL